MGDIFTTKKSEFYARFFCIFLSVFILCSCSHFDVNKTKTHQLHVTINKDDQRVRFSGKGAGAGMMLMSSMGPMGIAVGVAIDEGIGKDIDEVANASSLDIVLLVKEAFDQALSAIEVKPQGDINIEIERYGFITAAGEGDPVIAELALKINDAESIRFPDIVPEQERTRLTAQLDTVKTDAVTIKEQYKKASTLLAQYWGKQSATAIND